MTSLTPRPAEHWLGKAFEVGNLLISIVIVVIIIDGDIGTGIKNMGRSRLNSEHTGFLNCIIWARQHCRLNICRYIG